VRTIQHVIFDSRNPPKKDKKSKPKESETNNDKREFLSRASERFFEDEKEKLIEQFPESASKIRSVESGFDLELLAEKLQEDAVPKKVKGKATLIQQPDYSSSLTQAENEAKLINRLYQKATTRDKQQQKQKELAKSKIDKMYKSMVENVNLGRAVKRIGDSLGDYNTCPKCGLVVEANFNRKGVVCPECGFVVGQGSYYKVY